MFPRLKNEILGNKYSLSIAYISERKSQELNKKYRKKNKPTNVLAFPLDKTSGEILLCKPVIRREAKNFDRTFEEFLGFLIIHGMLHLKGYDHGRIMERLESKYDKKYFRRHRSRLLGHESDSGRVRKRRKKS